MNNKSNLENVLFNKDRGIPKDNLKIEKIYRDSPVFPLEILPKNFSNIKKGEISFIRKTLIKRNVPKIRKYFNLKISLDIDCYLLNSDVCIEDVIKFVFSVLEGIAFKNKNNI